MSPAYHICLLSLTMLSPPTAATAAFEILSLNSAGDCEVLGAPSEPFNHVPGTGWTVSNLSVPEVVASITTPEYSVVSGGEVSFTVIHECSFEYSGTVLNPLEEAYDGANLSVSINGGDFLLFENWTAGGYTPSAGGVWGLGFVPGWSSVQSLTSSGTISGLNAGDTVQFRFTAGWDSVFFEEAPNWVISSMTATNLAPPPQLSIRRSGDNWLLDYTNVNPGVALLHHSDSLATLGDGYLDFFNNDTEPSKTTVDVTNLIGGRSDFFTINEVSGDEYFNYTELADLAVESSLSFSTELVAEISELQSGIPFVVSFRLLDAETLEMVPVNGTVRFNLVRPNGQPVAFDYGIDPETLPIISGECSGELKITSATDLNGTALAIREIETGSPPAMLQTSDATIGSVSPAIITHDVISGLGILNLLPKHPDEYKDISWEPEPPTLQYPLRDLSSPAAVSGSYGEWRNKKKAVTGRPHKGIDLAAPAGEFVYPIRPGVVTAVQPLVLRTETSPVRLGYAMGYYVTVYHGNGYASRYLHVEPSVYVNQIVDTGTVLGIIWDFPPKGSTRGDHLHFEIRENVPVDYRQQTESPRRVPGQTINPGNFTGDFTQNLIVNGVNDTRAPEVKALYLWNGSLADVFPRKYTSGVKEEFLVEDDWKTLVLQIIDEEGRSKLVPYRIRLYVEEPTTGFLFETTYDLPFTKESEIEKLFSPKEEDGYGYVLRPEKNETDREDFYLMGFKWETLQYDGYPEGPRQVELVLDDIAGNQSNTTFSFGPELSGPQRIKVAPDGEKGDVETFTVEMMMGPPPEEMSSAVVDQVTVSIDASNAISFDISFDGLAADAKMQSFNMLGHEARQSFDIRASVKDGSAPGLSESFVLKAESKLFPGIRHELEVPVSTFGFEIGEIGQFLNAASLSTPLPESNASLLSAGTIMIDRDGARASSTITTQIGSTSATIRMHGNTELRVNTSVGVVGAQALAASNVEVFFFAPTRITVSGTISATLSDYLYVRSYMSFENYSIGNRNGYYIIEPYGTVDINETYDTSSGSRLFNVGPFRDVYSIDDPGVYIKSSTTQDAEAEATWDITITLEEIEPNPLSP